MNRKHIQTKKKRKVFLKVISAIGLLFAGIYFGVEFVSINNQHISTQNYVSNPINSEQDIINNCQGLGLQDTAKCLVTNVDSIYQYKVTDDNISLNFEQLKLLGGDCRDWSLLYKDMAEKLGYYGTYSTMYTSPDSKHAVAFISNKGGYCLLDQQNVKCQNFIIKKEEKA